MFILAFRLSISIELGANRPFSNALAENDKDKRGAVISYEESLSLNVMSLAIISMGWMELVSSRFTEDMFMS